MAIKPWNEEAKRIFNRISKTGRAYTTDINFARSFGRRCKAEINSEFIEIARIEKRQKTVFLLGENTVAVPKKGKFFFYKI